MVYWCSCSPIQQASGSEGSGQEEGGSGAESEGPDLLSELPPEALRATTRSQFVHHMRPYMWVKFPSAMASEISAFINARWSLLKASKKMEAGTYRLSNVGVSDVGVSLPVKGERRRRSEVDTLGVEFEEEEGTSRSSRQRAAKKVPVNAYTMDLDDFEYVDSPASSAHSRDTSSTTGGGTKKGKPGRKKRRRGRPPVAKGEPKAEPRVPPMKIKMIGRSGKSDSPIFFAESMESWDEGSGSEKGEGKGKMARLKERGLDSENSSVVLGEGEEEDDDEVSKPVHLTAGCHVSLCSFSIAVPPVRRGRGMQTRKGNMLTTVTHVEMEGNSCVVTSAPWLSISSVWFPQCQPFPMTSGNAHAARLTLWRERLSGSTLGGGQNCRWNLRPWGQGLLSWKMMS